MATIVHANNIKHDLQQMEKLLFHEEILDTAPAAGEKALSAPGIEAHLSRIENNIEFILKLEKKYEAGESHESISGRLSERFDQFKSGVERVHREVSVDYNSIRNVFGPLRITLLQMESLHLTVNSENLEAYSHYKSKFIKNFLALVAAMLITGLYVVTKAFSRMNQVLRESEDVNY